MSHTLSDGQKITRRTNMAQESRARQVDVLIAEGRAVTATCFLPACRHSAEIDLPALSVAGHGRRDIQQMGELKCSACGARWPHLKVW